MSQTRRRVAAVAAAAILVPTLGGCWQGFNAQTSQQANQAVGNGTNLATGDVEIRGATWVRTTANPQEATLVATFINNGDEPDRLVKVEVQPTAATGRGFTRLVCRGSGPAANPGLAASATNQTRRQDRACAAGRRVRAPPHG